ncbi:AGAP001500-PA-like protein [Anopheles sinensis]|uniref:AGAP001500-PA-like protein n=1 Tax=Anopheles sinensis TaxID=74873 RepID=A0A084W546_ANOSI|nr:AGAP001500-PA-like protein [Anopheles sinensis]
MEQFSHDLTLALEETSRTTSSKVRWGVRRRTRSTGNLPCAPQPTEDSSSSPTDPPVHNVVMNQADSPCLSGSNNLIQSDSDDRHSVAFAFKLRQTPLGGNFESDSLNENFSPARPNMRRKRKYKRMAVEYETTPSTPHISGSGSAIFPVAGTVKKRVFKHSACPDSFRSTMFFCGKRKRGQRDRGGLDYDFCKQHSSSVPRQREFFGPKVASYSEYKSRNRAASFSASMMKCERILPLNKTVVSKIERISADRDRERLALLEASRTGGPIPSLPVAVPGAGEFNFSIPLQLRPGETPGSALPSGSMSLGGGSTVVGPLGIRGHITNIALNQPMASATPGAVPPLPEGRINPLQQLAASAASMVTIGRPAQGGLGPTPAIPMARQTPSDLLKPLVMQPFGRGAGLDGQLPFHPALRPLMALATTSAEPIPSKAAGGGYPKEKHRHRKSKYIRKKQMLMMSGPEGQGQMMDCGGQVNDFLSSSSLSSSDSEAVLANETDHEGDDELTDWPGNEAMITFASKHDFRKAYHGTRSTVGATSSSTIGRPVLPLISGQDDQDLPDDDTLMSSDELLPTNTSTAPAPPMAGGVPMGVSTLNQRPLHEASAMAGDHSIFNTLDPNLSIASEVPVVPHSVPFLVNTVGPGMPLANEIREIRAGCRRIREERPGFSIISSVNELLSRFLQDDQQRELTLHDVDEAEHDKLQDLCRLYSLNAQQIGDSGGVLVLSKTSNTMQSVRIDQSNLPKRLGDFKRRCYGTADTLQFHDGTAS